MTAKPYTCTEVTVEYWLGRNRVRLWIGTKGLMDWELTRWQAETALQVMRKCDSDDPSAIAEFARVHLAPYLNAVQVLRLEQRTMDNQTHTVTVGVMGYTTAFDENDETRFGSWSTLPEPQ